HLEVRGTVAHDGFDRGGQKIRGVKDRSAGDLKETQIMERNSRLVRALPALLVGALLCCSPSKTQRAQVVGNTEGILLAGATNVTGATSVAGATTAAGPCEVASGSVLSSGSV